MHKDTFLQPYNRQLPTSVLDVQEGGSDIRESRVWSQAFGQILYDAIQGAPPDLSKADRLIENYGQWLATDFPGLQNSIDSLDTSRGYRLSNEINFHALNQGMIGGWMALLDPGLAEPRVRKQVLRVSQDALALQGLKYYAAREKSAHARGNYAYFNEENDQRRATFEGKANEFDAGIVLLEMMIRNRELIVVPAPLQFESHSRKSNPSASKSNNVDFVVLMQDAAVGVQVKSQVSQSDYAKYDTGRVVLIDAAADLGNDRRIRTSQRSTRMKKVAWGGMICAQRVAAIPTHGPDAILHQQNRAEVVRSKFLAKQLVGGTKSYFDKATEVVSDRVLYAITKDQAVL